MINWSILLLAAVLLALLLCQEKKENRGPALGVKTLLSLLFVAAAAIQPRPAADYYPYLLTGLALCLAGDVFLALPERFFRAGLAAFLLGHIFYILAFASLANIGRWFSPWALIFFAGSAGVFYWLRPHLGSMLGPVSVYVAVITVMVCAALAVFRETSLPGPGRTLILFGAVSFYFSDVFVARNKFIRDEFLNRLVGLPLYYLGQFSLAFSPGLVG